MAQREEICSRCGCKDVVIVTETLHVVKSDETPYKEDVFLKAVRCLECDKVMQDDFSEVESSAIFDLIEDDN